MDKKILERHFRIGKCDDCMSSMKKNFVHRTICVSFQLVFTNAKIFESHETIGSYTALKGYKNWVLATMLWHNPVALVVRNQ